ncbi:hypothetical protein [Propionicimonas sp. T2.31MG-18]|uniref:hypothetical protein n=1 Tax=Propionicimonas sp. T2.31MG-18 TaxID=3157620 RepID=UPI00367111E3
MPLHRSGPPGPTTGVLVHGIGMTHRTFADLRPAAGLPRAGRLGGPPRLRGNGTSVPDVLDRRPRGGLGWYLATLRTMFAYDIAEQLTRPRVPVVVVRGEHDPV